MLVNLLYIVRYYDIYILIIEFCQAAINVEKLIETDSLNCDGSASFAIF